MLVMASPHIYKQAARSKTSYILKPQLHIIFGPLYIFISIVIIGKGQIVPGSVDCVERNVTIFQIKNLIWYKVLMKTSHTSDTKQDCLHFKTTVTYIWSFIHIILASKYWN